MSSSLQFHVLWHTRIPCASLSPWVCSKSRPLSWLSIHLILCCTLLLLPSFFPNIRVFSRESALPIRADQSTGASPSASVLPMNIQGSFPLGLTGLISLLSRDSQESSPAPQLKSINSLALSFLYGPTLTPIHSYWKNHNFDYRPV